MLNTLLIFSVTLVLFFNIFSQHDYFKFCSSFSDEINQLDEKRESVVICVLSKLEMNTWQLHVYEVTRSEPWLMQHDYKIRALYCVCFPLTSASLIFRY